MPLLDVVRRTATPAACIVAVLVVAFGNALDIPFVLDDQASVVQNEDIRVLSNLGRVLLPSPNGPTAGRPLVSLSFAVNYAVGGVRPRGYHVINLVLHIASALLVFGVVRRTISLDAQPGALGRHANAIALAVALLWGVHPLTSEVVDYVTQRTEVLMAVFLLLTLYASIRAHQTSDGPWHGVAIAAALGGALSKETIVVAPLLVALYDRAFLYDGWRSAWTARRPLYTGLVACWFIVAAFLTGNPRGAVGGFSAGVGVWTYLLNQTVVIGDYLRKAVWPVELVAFYGWPEPLTLGDVWPQALIVVTLLALAGFAWRLSRPIGFWAAWFFLTLAPTSSFVPIATEVGADRRMYLPLVALTTMAVLALWKLVRKWTLPLWVPVTLVGVVAASSVVTTRARNAEYESPLRLAQTIVDRRPSGVSHHMLGEQLAVAGRLDEGATELRRAIALGNTRAHYQLGVLLLRQGDTRTGARELESVVALEGVPQRLQWLEPPLLEVLQARALLGQVYAAEARWSEAEVQARAVLSRAPRHVEAHRVLAAALAGQQRWTEAIDSARVYLEARPADAQALVNLGVALVATGRLDEAIATFERALDADPKHPTAQRLLDFARQDRQQAAPRP